MDIKLKKRIVGVGLLLALGLILIPSFFNHMTPGNELQLSAHVPEPPPKPKDLLEALPGKDVTTPTMTAAASNTDAAPTPDTLATTQIQTIDSASVEIASVSAATPSEPAAAPQANAPSAPEMAANAAPMNAEIPPSAAIVNPSEIPKATQPSTAPQAFAVQLGSFTTKANAERLMKKIQAQGYPAYIHTTKTSHGDWVRVLVGPQLRRSEAEVLLQKLNRVFETKGMIVKANF
ncbi:MAG: SPOR domain-containing protein [Gammaproteobacteria bacterium]